MGRISSPGRGELNHTPTSSRPALGAIQRPIQWVKGVIFEGMKRPGREADHSPPTFVEVKITWIYISIDPYVVMECNAQLVKQMNNLNSLSLFL
jgi:hypothetical protein